MPGRKENIDIAPLLAKDSHNNDRWRFSFSDLRQLPFLA